MNCREILQQSEKMFSRRGSWLSYCQAIADQFYPERRDFTQSLVLGDELASHLFESYPVVARRELGNALSTMLRPRSKQWFHASTGRPDLDDLPSVKAWFEHADKVMYRAIYDPKAQFVRATKQCDHDYVAFGNGVISYEESPTRDALFFRNWHLRDCAWVEDDTGVINRLDRKMKMQARNVVRRWPKTAHADIKRSATQDPFKEWEIVHIVMPADEYETAKKAGKRPWVSLYIDRANEVVLQEGFVHEFGYVVPRWHLVSGFEYAFSPATVAALGDGRMLQDLSRILIESAEKALDPPMVATQEALRSDVNIYAGGITWVDANYDEKTGDPLRQLEQRGNVNVGVELQQSVRAMLTEAFFLNKLTIPNTTGDMTATEVQIRVEEYIRGALPVFEPIEVEYNAPLLDGVFNMLMRNRAFDMKNFPKELHGKEITYVFDSPIQTNEKTLKVAAFQQVAQIAGIKAQVAQVEPSLDWDVASRDAYEGAGAAADWFKSEDELAVEAEQKQQEAALGNVATLLQQGAGVAGQVADASMKMQEAGIA